MLVPNFSVVKLARKAAYRSDGDLLATARVKPVKARGKSVAAGNGAATPAKAKVATTNKKS